MPKSLWIALGLSVALAGCAPAPAESSCVTRNVLASMTPAGAEDCGNFGVSEMSGVRQIAPIATIECANRAIGEQRPFVVGQTNVVGSQPGCSGDALCPLRHERTSAWIGQTVGGRYLVTQVFDSSDSSLPNMALSAFSRSCAPATGAKLQLLNATSTIVTLQCDASSPALQLDSLAPQSVCSTRDR